ncbi:MAG: hypothetical protein ALECFALPRED_000103 [Alectoria fallacina]|uniref:F-box domain-containing protein n=1 Tax=Alectoria fallacina TaxID=1903189 RepID=A0A8H3I4J7_9LECA|nr:MAG: hypothetical protein ALECFALPRED_000103 [Alectoria fallacina]
MESEESILRPCKSLPPPFRDLDALQNRASPHLGNPSSGQGDMAPGLSNPAKEIEGNFKAQEDVVVVQQGNKSVPLKGKGHERATLVRKEGPLQLLDLPLDILKDIFKEVTHTSDLCSLAASNSALHSVATPLIYSRFDIVWPETHNLTEPRTGVDALTYGLATLVMREDLFDHDMLSNSPTCGASCQRYACTQCGTVNLLNQTSNIPVKHRRLRRGNYFSQFTKKFSLGNGPADWVAEYLVTKESGKMLGTLVALSVARMPNLESFVWDMPTGVLRDIWTALSSLGDYQSPKLEKLWVRLHDNRESELTQTNTAPQPAQATPGQAPALPPPQGTLYQNFEFGGSPRLVLAKNHREEPNFSIMPPLRSLTVLDIDELAYLEELSVLLERSLDKLRELRIGFAPILYSSCNDREQPPLKYVIKGGPLPLLMSKINDYLLPKYDTETGQLMTRPDDATKEDPNPLNTPDTSNEPNQLNHELPPGLPEPKVPGMNLDAIDPALLEERASHERREMLGPQSGPERSPPGILQDPVGELETSSKPIDHRSVTQGELQDIGTVDSTTSHNSLEPTRRLKLETLEIEKVSLHMVTLYETIDWTILTSLTLLNCGGTETLWSCLQENFPPRKTLVVSIPTQSAKKRESQPRLRRMPSSEALSKASEYPLRLKRIHTNHVSSALISFLKHALAPDSLEWLFLQDTSMYGSSVTLDVIYRGPLRRHRSSLTKVMIDSASPGSRTRGVTARKWMLSREVLSFISSGKMSRLRELAMTIQYKDWHFFLQRLPQIPHLRSLYVPYIADHPYGGSLNVKDFAMSAIDVVALRPEVELCYLGIREKCFEILETTDSKKSKDGATTASANIGGGETDDDDDDDAEVHHDHNDDDDDSEDEDPASMTQTTQAQGMDSDIDPITDDDEPDPASNATKIKLKLREILFYEDRISIFKARHGRL